VLDAIQNYLVRADRFFSRRDITYSASCKVTAATSVDDQIWTAGARPDARMFVGSAVKTFILAEYLQQIGVPGDRLSLIDDDIRSISSSVFGFDPPNPDVNLEGPTLTRNVLEAMISHSDNTATDSILSDVGADKVRELIADVGLSSVKIPESTRRLLTYLASGRNIDVDWEKLQELVASRPDPRDAINKKQTMLASASDMVRWYQTALLEPGFFERTGALAEFKRISSMADALHRVVPDNLASYGKGGSITWNGFSCISVSGQMIMPTRDLQQPWIPLTFSFVLNWGRDSPITFGKVAALFAETMKNVLQASLDAFYWTVTDFTLTLGDDVLAGTSGRDDFAGPGGGTDALQGLGGHDSFRIRASQMGSIDGGAGYDTVNAVDDELNPDLTFANVEALHASLPSIQASVAQIAAFSAIVPDAGGTEFHVFLRNEGGRLDFSSLFASQVRLNVDGALTSSRLILTGTERNDSLLGSAFDDILVGGGGDDTIAGGDGNDVIAGGAGLDTLDGGTGYNAATYANAARAVRVDLASGAASGQGNDTLANFQSVIGSVHDDWLAGDASANTLYGGDGDDTINGRAGDDRLVGGNGADRLIGGLGADLLTGGGGPDLFEFTRIAESTVAGAGRDRITDFDAAEGDLIDLRAIDAVAGVAGDQAFAFIGTSAFSHTAGELNYRVAGALTFLDGDVNGDAVADFSIALNNVPTLTAAGIVL
jgi:Ca2+-binding RTX toxin-like protein/beta-lactamase class A